MKKFVWIGAALLAAAFILWGCGSIHTTEAKLSDLDYTVVSNDNIEEDIQKLIDEKKENPFQMTYSDGNYKYIVIGYGRQETGGYSIQVQRFMIQKYHLRQHRSSWPAKRGGAGDGAVLSVYCHKN